ncbi:TcpD family membrane protein [Fructobacillus cardui]|uniref:TcpD family membrane protein n=1 Tax=Fructobacillus cardui TaxID=2893170 RepID=UPI002DB30920|nr:hypothetical protein R53653_IHELHDKM_00711 [Fructobacillus cardui]
MSFYSGVKILFLTVVFFVVAFRASGHYAKKETVALWITIGIGAVVYQLVQDPQGILSAPGGIIHSLINFIGGIGG